MLPMPGPDGNARWRSPCAVHPHDLGAFIDLDRRAEHIVPDNVHIRLEPRRRGRRWRVLDWGHRLEVSNLWVLVVDRRPAPSRRGCDHYGRHNDQQAQDYQEVHEPEVVIDEIGDLLYELGQDAVGRGLVHWDLNQSRLGEGAIDARIRP